MEKCEILVRFPAEARIFLSISTVELPVEDGGSYPSGGVARA